MVSIHRLAGMTNFEVPSFAPNNSIGMAFRIRSVVQYCIRVSLFSGFVIVTILSLAYADEDDKTNAAANGANNSPPQKRGLKCLGRFMRTSPFLFWSVSVTNVYILTYNWPLVTFDHLSECCDLGGSPPFSTGVVFLV